MRDEEANKLLRGEASILKARNELVSSVVRLGYQEVGGRLRVVRTTSQESEAGTTCAVRNTDGTRELNAA